MQDFQEPNGYMTWTKHKIHQDDTQKCDMSKGYPNHIKESNQHKIDSKDLSHCKKLIKLKNKRMR